ncbi:leucine-rich repeat domain-containing protein [Fluviispira multicolorata]|uniref:Leucine-rich repeat protein n=1 Tax=Fluviispira multicolorata TaxID=2654512 RepID=A0A833JAY7_9BACT|nr:leucine-rich repeat domain-containing protein [Fluviispira multicolorata]KAB8028495.1 leucine-rich repeat protein [Fluviispira multicolorata]
MFLKILKSKKIFFPILMLSCFSSVSFADNTCNSNTEIQEERCLKSIINLDLSNKKIKNIEEYFKSHDINIQSVELLNLNKNNIEDISYLGNFKNLRELWLQDNKISIISDSFANLTGLKVLDLSKNNITEIPDSFFRLTNLTVLNLNRNKLKMIPESIAQLKNLEKLYLNGKSRKTLKNKCLSFFGLQNGEITTIPESLTTLSKLRVLDLSYNLISDIPDSFYNLSNLGELDISYTLVRILPDFLLDERFKINVYFEGTQFEHTLRVNKHVGKVYEDCYIRKTGLL